jgi:poly-gamma-glutamate synthesis protein (capsule biosynthesis protein)
VTLANNHALDFGPTALLDTLDHLHRAGIATVGAGRDESEARRPAVLDAGGLRVGVVGFTDHPPDYAAGPGRPGVAYADLRRGPPRWVLDTVATLGTDVVVVTPHWGPNMVAEPVPSVRRAAEALRAAGATLVAGHSAHVFHGVSGLVLYDLGDFIDDYVTDPDLRNDLGLPVTVTFEDGRPARLEAVPLALDFCRTRLAEPAEAAWVTDRFGRACSALGTHITDRHGVLVAEWEAPHPD